MVKLAGEKDTDMKQKQDKPVVNGVHIPVQNLPWKFPVETNLGQFLWPQIKIWAIQDRTFETEVFV